MNWGLKVISTARERSPASEQARVAAAVAQSELQLRWAQDNVRSAGELLRRAMRTAENAKAAHADAVRRLDRIDAWTGKVG